MNRKEHSHKILPAGKETLSRNVFVQMQGTYFLSTAPLSGVPHCYSLSLCIY